MTYLNLVADIPGVSAVVDVNPRKVGAGVPGTAHVIGSPKNLIDIEPTTVLIANPVYRDEIAAELRALGVHAELVPLWD